MKIVGTSNFDNETVNDFLAADNIPNELYGQIMVDSLNSKFGEDSTYYFKLVDDDYVLHRWEP